MHPAVLFLPDFDTFSNCIFVYLHICHLCILYIYLIQMLEKVMKLQISTESGVLTKLDWMITSREQKGKTINNISLIVFPPFSCYFAGNPFERGLLSNKRCMYCKTGQADMSRSRGYLCALPTKQLLDPKCLDFCSPQSFLTTQPQMWLSQIV